MSAVYHDYVNIAGNAQAAGLSGASAADVQIIAVPYKCQVRRFAIVWLTTGAAEAKVAFDQQPTAGSATGRVELSLLTKPAAEHQGKYIYKDPTTSVVLNEGDAVVVEVTDVEAASTFLPVLLVERMPEQPANQADMLASA
jgi:hypothetical protein